MQPETVLVEAIRGVADRAEDSGREIVATAHVVEHFVRLRIEEHPVDREVAAQGVLARPAELHVRGMAMVQVCTVATERGDFDADSVLDHQDDSELHADRGSSAGRAAAPAPHAPKSRRRSRPVRAGAGDHGRSRRRGTPRGRRRAGFERHALQQRAPCPGCDRDRDRRPARPPPRDARTPPSSAQFERRRLGLAGPVKALD